MQVRKKLTEVESTVAFITGGGLALIILAFLLSSARGSTGGNTQTLDLMLGIGFLGLIGGSLGWALATQPWKNFDNWATPLYLGPDASHGGHDAAHSEVHTEPHAVTHLEPEPVMAAVAEIPAGTSEPAPITHLNVEPLQKVAPDNLTAIDGIGPKIVTALNNAGIKTFADLIARSPEDIEKIVRDSGVRMVGHATNWVAQAKTIMANQSQP